MQVRNDPQDTSQNQEVLDLLELSWPAVDALDRETTVILMTGGPTEQHGPHLPLGTDVIAADEVHARITRHVAAAGYTAVVAPPIFYGPAQLSATYPGSATVRRDVFTELLIDVLGSFAGDGFGAIVTTTQHIDPPYVRAWEQACETVNEQHGARAVHGFERLVLEDVLHENLTDVLGVDMAGDSHAGTYETAVVRRLRPDLVDEDVLSTLPRMMLDFATDLQAATSFHDLGDGRGYTGDPQAGLAQHGGTILDRYTSRYWALLDRHLRGEDVSDELTLAGLRRSSEVAS